MFNSRPNNSLNVNVNTKLHVFYSDKCMLAVGAWNDKLSLKFHPFKGTNDDGLRQYSQDNNEIINTSLTMENATALYEGVKAKLNPAIEEKREESVSVMIGANDTRKMLTLSTDGNDISLTIYKNVSDTGIANPENSMTYIFNKKEYMVGYDPLSGSGEVVATNAEYEIFVKKIKDIKDISMASSHGINYSNAIKNTYSNKQALNNNVNTAYQAPTNNYSGDNMGDFLPWQ